MDFGEKLRACGEASQSGDFETASRLLSEAIELDPQNAVLFSNRYIVTRYDMFCWSKLA